MVQRMDWDSKHTYMVDLGFQMSLQFFSDSSAVGTLATRANTLPVASGASRCSTSHSTEGQNHAEPSGHPHKGRKQRDTGTTEKCQDSDMSKLTAARGNSDWSLDRQKTVGFEPAADSLQLEDQRSSSRTRELCQITTVEF